MTLIKTEAEIREMEKGGKILAEGLELLKEKLVEGIETRELDQIFNRFCFSKNAAPAFLGYRPTIGDKPFPASICVSINEDVVHGIPTGRKLKAGDVVKIDAGVKYNGLITDAAFTKIIAGGTEEAQKLIKVTEAALFKAIDQVKEGARIGDISSEMETTVLKNNFNVFKSLAGHGVGRGLHEDPLIPTFGQKGKGAILKAGMTLAIEAMVTVGNGDLATKEDGWTMASADGKLTAQFEHTVLVTKEGYKILTALQ